MEVFGFLSNPPTISVTATLSARIATEVGSVPGSGGPNFPCRPPLHTYFARNPSTLFSESRRCAHRRTSARTLSVADGRKLPLGELSIRRSRLAQGRHRNRRPAP